MLSAVILLTVASLAQANDPVIVRESDVAQVVTVGKGQEVVIEVSRTYGEFTRWKVSDNKISDAKHKTETHVLKGKDFPIPGAKEVTYYRFTAEKSGLVEVRYEFTQGDEEPWRAAKILLFRFRVK